jgi:hypothetical protein
MDGKGWSFNKAFEKLGVKTESFFYKKGNFAFLEKNKHVKDLCRSYIKKWRIKIEDFLNLETTLIGR